MAQNALWKVPDGEGGFTELHPETNAVAVKYGTSNVKSFLDTVTPSAFMKTLLTAKDATAARKVLGVSKEAFFDEAGGKWLGASARIETDNKKFGTSSLYLQGTNSYIRNNNVTLGGRSFAIAGWFYQPAATTSADTLFNWGTTANRINVFIDVRSYITLKVTTNSADTISFASADRTTQFDAGKWNHVELDYYYSENKFYLFYNGAVVCTGTDSAFADARTFPFYLGCDTDLTSNFKGYADEFLIYKPLLHSAKFTPPTEPYEFNANAYALLHFD